MSTSTLGMAAPGSSSVVIATEEPAPCVRPASAERLPHVLTPADRKLRLINMMAVTVPFLGLIAAIALLWGVAFDWMYLGIMGGMLVVTSTGITVGYHRLFTHSSFTTSPVVRYALAAAGSMAVQGPVIEWCGAHRLHHQHSDDPRDPHSPHMHPGGSWGEGLWATVRGAWHAHIGWLFAGHQKGMGKYTRDLWEDPVLAAASRHFKIWVLLGLIIPAVVGGLLTMTWTGVLSGFLWGGLVRCFLVHHITWSINSVCHLWGSQPFDCQDESRNNPLIGVLAGGEGWHNNHHAFPTSARHGLRWWELDLSYVFIRMMGMLGLARNIRNASPERVAAMRKGRGADGPFGR